MSARAAGLALLLCLAACRDDHGLGPTWGSPAEWAFTDLDGAQHRPLDVTGAKANVLIFTTVDCPVANVYAPEITSIISDHIEDPLRFYLVHVDPDTTVAKAREHAREYGLAGSLILDPEHKLVVETGATITPEAVVITVDGKIAYRGRIDNLYGGLGRKRLEATRHELRDVLRAVLGGREVESAGEEAVGCLIADLK